MTQGSLRVALGYILSALRGFLWTRGASAARWRGRARLGASLTRRPPYPLCLRGESIVSVNVARMSLLWRFAVGSGRIWRGGGIRGGYTC